MKETKSRSLGDFREFPVPPAGLEERVVDVLKTRGLILPANRGVAKMNMHYAMTAVVAIISLLIGVFAGQRFDAAPVETDGATGQHYALFLYEDASYVQPEAGHMDERIAEYRRWAQTLAAEGKLVAGEKLAEGGSLLAADGSDSAVVPGAEQGSLTGYFIIAAKDLEEARSIAATCPHLRYGGAVSLRRVET